MCEQITGVRAHSFYHAIEPLTAYRRRALCAIYAFARGVRDAADGTLPHAEKLRVLAEARAGIPHGGTPRPVDPVLLALRDVNRRFRLPLGSLDDLIDGAERDVHGLTTETFDELVDYCRQVAGSIGRLSVTVLGSRDPVAAARLADDLAVAIELTKLLRDLVEDYERGRVYLPSEDLARFGCPADPAAAPAEALSAVIGNQAQRIHGWYDWGLRLLPLLDARGAACAQAMTGIHTRILDRIERSPNEVLQSGIWPSGAESAPAELGMIPWHRS